jgi:hypothetical protein
LAIRSPTPIHEHHLPSPSSILLPRTPDYFLYACIQSQTEQNRTQPTDRQIDRQTDRQTPVFLSLHSNLLRLLLCTCYSFVTALISLFFCTGEDSLLQILCTCYSFVTAPISLFFCTGEGSLLQRSSKHQLSITTLLLTTRKSPSKKDQKQKKKKKPSKSCLPLYLSLSLSLSYCAHEGVLRT